VVTYRTRGYESWIESVGIVFFFLFFISLVNSSLMLFLFVYFRVYFFPLSTTSTSISTFHITQAQRKRSIY
jgi:hypothetical protein